MGVMVPIAVPQTWLHLDILKHLVEFQFLFLNFFMKKIKRKSTTKIEIITTMPEDLLESLLKYEMDAYICAQW